MSQLNGIQEKKKRRKEQKKGIFNLAVSAKYSCCAQAGRLVLISCHPKSTWADAMQIQLRPLNLGEILDRTFQIYHARFLIFVGIATVSAALELLWNACQVVLTFTLLHAGKPSKLLAVLRSIDSLAGLGVTVVALSLSLAATTCAVMALHLEKPAGIAQAFSEVWRHWARYILVNLAAFVIAWSPIIVLIAAGIGVVAAARGSLISGARPLPALYLGLGIIFVIGAPLCIWLTLRYSLANAACVVEKIGVWKSLKRSVILSKGLRWRIFLMLGMVLLFQSIFVSLLVAPLLPLVLHARGHIPIGVAIYNLAVGFVANCLITPIYAIGLTLFYLDARIRKEGFDVEWMLERSLHGAAAEGTSTPPLSTEAHPGLTHPGLE